MMPPQLGLRRGAVSRRSGLRSGFEPSDVSGLVLWLDATVGLTISVSSVTDWADQSGNGNNFTQGTAANQPTYNATGLNGKPTVDFDGSNDYMTALDSADFDSAAGYTFFFVIKKDAKAGNNELLRNRSLGGLGTTPGFGIGFDTSTYDNVLFEDASAEYRANIDQGTPNEADAMVLEIVTDLSSFELFEDGISEFTGFSHTSGGSVGTVTSANALFLGSSPTPSRYFIGQLSELAMYNVELASGDRDSIRTYLTDKWAIT